NDPREFANLVKAISLPQDVSSTFDRHLIELENQVQCLMKAHIAPTAPVQVSKITSSCEICSGPNDTQNCMENPEQAFVDYASLNNNKVGGEELSVSEIVIGEGESRDIKRDNPNDRVYGDIKKVEEEREWMKYKEPLDLVDTHDELIYESLIEEMPSCSLNFYFRIEKGDPTNLKIPCMIGHKFIANAYIDLDSSINVMSLAVTIPLEIRKSGDGVRIFPGGVASPAIKTTIKLAHVRIKGHLNAVRVTVVHA
nr:MAK10-like protein [Tanacetum cinerariifolium]